jgi:hypothetical protein
MELTITNYSGQPLIVFTSDSYFDKSYMTKALKVKDLLRIIGNQGWLSSVTSGVYADQIDQLITTTKASLSPQMKFHDFILAGDNAFLNNIFALPKYMYCIGITTREAAFRNKLALSFNVFAVSDLLSTYTQPEDLLARFSVFIGNNSKFYCDNITVDGNPVCEYELPRSAKFINQSYQLRHNPRLNVVSSETPVGLDFDTSMIESIKSSERTVYLQPQIGAAIPAPGYNGDAAVAYLFINNDTTVTEGDEPSYDIIPDSSIWPPIAILLLVLLIIAIVVGALMYISKRSSINIFGSKENTELPSIRI